MYFYLQNLTNYNIERSCTGKRVEEQRLQARQVDCSSNPCWSRQPQVWVSWTFFQTVNFTVINLQLYLSRYVYNIVYLDMCTTFFIQICLQHRLSRFVNNFCLSRKGNNCIYLDLLTIVFIQICLHLCLSRFVNNYVYLDLLTIVFI